MVQIASQRKIISKVCQKFNSNLITEDEMITDKYVIIINIFVSLLLAFFMEDNIINFIVRIIK